MATERLKTIKVSGGDYTSLSAAEAGEDDLGDLVSRDEWMHFSCYTMEDTTKVTVTGWTTDATRFIQIDTPSAARHAGEWDTGKYYLNISDGTAIYIAQKHVHITGLQFQFEETRAGYNASTGISSSWDYTGGLQVDKCIFRGVNGGVNSNGLTGIYLNNSYFGEDIKIQNNIFIGADGGWSDNGVRVLGAAVDDSIAYIYNCTFKDNLVGIEATSDTQLSVYVKNCGFISCGSATDGTITGTATNSTSTPTLASGKSFHLASNDTTWHGQGTDLSADAGIINSEDIDGESRGSTWDIGADQYVTEGEILPIFNINVGGNFLPKKIKYYNSSIWINMEEYLISEANDAIVTEAGDYIVTTDGPTIKYYDGAEWKIFSA